MDTVANAALTKEGGPEVPTDEPNQPSEPISPNGAEDGAARCGSCGTAHVSGASKRGSGESSMSVQLSATV